MLFFEISAACYYNEVRCYRRIRRESLRVVDKTAMSVANSVIGTHVLSRLVVAALRCVACGMLHAHDPASSKSHAYPY